ncbi:MAG: hypothetical protein HYS52_02265 [Candidatus Wildermuthbacteria bacterium]|nr:hypothetical protein [Candidatus Wildermuthbacteria bacterium]
MRTIVAKLKTLVKRYQSDIILFTVVVLLCLLSFAAGFLVAREQLKGFAL